MKVIVINLNADRWEKYDNNYTRFQAIDGNKELDPQWVDDNYHFRHNCNRKLRQCIAGCSESHLKLLRHIIDNKIDNAIVLEDDTLLDFTKLELLKDVDEICYIGGQIKALTFTTKDFEKPTNLIEGINTIDKEKYKISGAFGYYIPHHKQAEILLSHNYKKRRGIDVEFMMLQKKGLIKYFLYPAIATLYLPDAVNGFSNPQMKIKNDFKYF